MNQSERQSLIKYKSKYNDNDNDNNDDTTKNVD